MGENADEPVLQSSLRLVHGGVFIISIVGKHLDQAQFLNIPRYGGLRHFNPLFPQAGGKFLLGIDVKMFNNVQNDGMARRLHVNKPPPLGIW